MNVMQLVMGTNADYEGDRRCAADVWLHCRQLSKLAVDSLQLVVRLLSGTMQQGIAVVWTNANYAMVLST